MTTEQQPTTATANGSTVTSAPKQNAENDPRGKLYSEEEVERRLRGQAKQLDELKAQLADVLSRTQAIDSERKALEQVGVEYKTQLESLLAREVEREKKLSERNASRSQALPESLRDLIPEGIGGEALSAHLDKLEALHIGRAKAADAQVLSGAVRSAAPLDIDQKLEALRAQVREKMLGVKK